MLDRVRLSLFCPNCLPGYHLPMFGALETGLFADYNLVVEVLDAPGPPGTTNPMRVVNGGAEFCLTGVSYFLMAQAARGDHFPARFIAIVHQRSPIGVLALTSSDIRAPEDLPGRRLAWTERKAWSVRECQAALTERGLGSPRLIDVDHAGIPTDLLEGEVEIVSCFVDTLTRVRKESGRNVRAIRLGGETYASGLVAADHVPTDVARRMAAAVADAYDLQRRDPEAGVAVFCARFPETSPADARESWSLVEPYAFTGPPTGSMDHTRWHETLEWLTRAHGFRPPEPSTVYRTELVATPGFRNVS